MGPRSPITFLKNKHNGFSLLEIIGVMASIATLTVMGIRHYQHYRQQSMIAEIKSDLSIIKQALNAYFQLTGCTASGKFPADKSHPDLIALGLPASYQARMPTITHYLMHIIESGLTTKNNKPVYLLKINAIMNPTLSNEQVRWYAKALHAAPTNTNHLLTWQLLPNNQSETDNPFWISNGSLTYFKALEQGFLNVNGLQGSYCAN